MAITIISVAGDNRRLLRPLRRCHRQELLDGPSWEMDELRANLRDIRRVNRLGGGISAILGALPDLLAEIPRHRAVEMLDLATGSADIPRAVADWAAREGRFVRLVASDASAAVLTVADEHVRGIPSIALASYDARAVPLPDRSVDIVLCSLALHHFEPVEAVAVLTEMGRLARRGFIVNDLVRCHSGYVAALVTSRILTRNRLTRHDAPLSVRRAYTPAEMDDLLRQAGIEDAVVYRRAMFRMVAVWKRSG